MLTYKSPVEAAKNHRLEITCITFAVCVQGKHIYEVTLLTKAIIVNTITTVLLLIFVDTFNCVKHQLVLLSIFIMISCTDAYQYPLPLWIVASSTLSRDADWANWTT